MAAPPTKPPNSPEGLAEVERALSVLQGRHPEHERTRREDEEKRAKLKAERDAVARTEGRRSFVRRMTFIGAAGIVGVIAVVGALSLRGELARRGRIEQAGDPYRALGFALVDTSSRSDPSSLSASVSAGCLLATAAGPPGTPVSVTHSGGTVEGPGPLLTCLCEGGHVSVTTPKPSAGLAILRTEASTLGGSRAFAFLPFHPGTTGRTDQPCAEASLDAWLDSKRWMQDAPVGTVHPLVPANEATSKAWLSADPRRAALRDNGFTVAAVVEQKAPFAVVEVPPATCVLLAASSPKDKPALRLRGGALAVGPAEGNAGYCTQAGVLALAQHDGTGDLTVAMAPAARIGGLAGLAELASKAALPLAAATVPDADRGWDAKRMLLADAIPESLVTAANGPDFAPDPEARIVALSVEKPNSVQSETGADVYSFCEPQLDTATASVCVFSGAQKWRAEGKETASGVARAKLPFWLFALQDVNEPAGLKVATQLLSLARRLQREGFEPTTIEGITELDKGAEILGRANEDGIVAFTLVPNAPWVVPYTDGPAWSIEGEPRLVPIKTLERVVVTAAAKTTLPPKATRRTVVFRHQRH